MLPTSDYKYELEIIRSQRKRTASIQIIDNKVRILVPKFLSAQQIDDLLKKKQSWIEKRIKDNATVLQKQYQDGELFSYLGEKYELCLQTDGKKSVDLIDKKLCVTGVETKKQIQKQLEIWYRKQALLVLQDRSWNFAPLVGVEPSALKVRFYKSRWGCCTNRGEVTYNWQLIYMPLDIIDYVVVHELCHILEPNHSKKFWSEVERVIPERKEKHRWLKDNGSRFLGILN